MRRSAFIAILSTISVPLAFDPVSAAWPVDGAPVCVSAGFQRLRAGMPDGSGGIYVAWEDAGQTPQGIRLQRILGDGSVAPGWPANGVDPAGARVITRSGVRLAPDGIGGCLIAWYEEPIFSSVADEVRLQRILGNGVKHPVWPDGGVQVVSGLMSYFTLYRRLEGLEPTPDGGCIVVVRSNGSGCHDGHCLSGGEMYFNRMNSAGETTDYFSGLVPHCPSEAPFARVLSDGLDGLYSISYSLCEGGSAFRHTIAGGEAATPLPVAALPENIEMGRVEDASVIAVLASRAPDNSIIQTWLHRNPDGSPFAGSSASGVLLPSSAQWHLAPDPSGSSIFAWRSSTATDRLRLTRFTAAGTVSPGWDPEGAVVVQPPSAIREFSISSDGTGGAFVVWRDERNGAAQADIYASRIFADGSVPPGLVGVGYPVVTAAGIQNTPMVVTMSPGVAIALWQDDRSGAGADIYAQLLRHDVPTPATASLARAEARPDRVSLEWRFSEAVPEAILQRSRDGSEWSELARLVAGSLGRVTYEDTDVRSGESLAYRITYQSDGQQVWTVPVWVEIPRAELALRVMPPTTRDRLSLEVTLVSGEPARLELVDVAGRRLQDHDVSRLGTDPTRLELELGSVASGIAWLRLRQGSEQRTLRVAITR